jgi:hypothetical protein
MPDRKKPLQHGTEHHGPVVRTPASYTACPDSYPNPDTGYPDKSPPGKCQDSIIP